MAAGKAHKDWRPRAKGSERAGEERKEGGRREEGGGEGREVEPEERGGGGSVRAEWPASDTVALALACRRARLAGGQPSPAEQTNKRMQLPVRTAGCVAGGLT